MFSSGMKRIIIPYMPADTPLPFFLAIEEWVAANLPEGEYFFAWQVNPTVICGRHQEIWLEVDLDYAKSHDIFVCRRKSGGGAVYADRQNVMFSYITRSDSVQTVFSNYTDNVCRMLRSLNIDAVPTGRNDIAINGKKVAGNAFLKLPGRSIVHGTMLYDADFDTMSKVLTPSRAKRISKGVVSVASRVTTLKAEGLSLSCDEFIRYSMDFLCKEGDYVLSESDISEIKEITESYLDKSFLAYPFSKSDTKYIEGVGEIALDIASDNMGLISSINIFGDFFPLQDVKRQLNSRLLGVRLDAPSIKNALYGFEPEKIIAGLTLDKFVSLLPNLN